MTRSLVVGIVFGAVFLALAFWGVPLRELVEAFALLQPLWLIPVLLVVVVQLVIRAERQRMLIAPLAPGTTLRRQFAILSMGFFCINTFPARLGEVVRPYLWRELDDVPIGAGIGVMFVERIFDLVGVFVALFIALQVVDVPSQGVEIAGQHFEPVAVARGAAWLVLPPLLGLFFAALFFGRPLAAFARSLQDRLGGQGGGWRRAVRVVLGLAIDFVNGLESVRDPRRLVGVTVLTALSFTAIALMADYSARAFQLEAQIGPFQGLAVLCVTMLGIALPAPPGFAGVFEASVRAGLALFGVYGGALDGVALAFALMVHWLPFLAGAVLALLSFWAEGIRLRDLFDFARGGAQRDASADSP